ncbi:MAG TPA: hypothetical protein VFW42_07925 [Fluviicoccus sp.]|nr:hypothetical protein [Fluviicoccus sp.]
MRDKSLNDRIINVLIAAGRPLSAAAIRRALPDAVEASELSYRLTYLRARGDIVAGKSRREANTGPLYIKVYTMRSEIVPFATAAQGALFACEPH